MHTCNLLHLKFAFMRRFLLKTFIEFEFSSRCCTKAGKERLCEWCCFDRMCFVKYILSVVLMDNFQCYYNTMRDSAGAFQVCAMTFTKELQTNPSHKCVWVYHDVVLRHSYLFSPSRHGQELATCIAKPFTAKCNEALGKSVCSETAASLKSVWPDCTDFSCWEAFLLYMIAHYSDHWTFKRWRSISTFVKRLVLKWGQSSSKTSFSCRLNDVHITLFVWKDFVRINDNLGGTRGGQLR